MAEVKVTDLPAITIEDFTPNDSFLIIDDGMVRRLTNSVFLVWLQANVKGEKGDQGVAGRDGARGKDGIVGRDGVDGLDAFQLAVREGYVGSIDDWFNAFKGDAGEDGIDGGDGWSPVFETETVGNGSYLKIVDWIGGTGDKPNTLGYLSDQGVVADILLATNIIGAKGDRGDIGIKGDTGARGVKGDDGEKGVRGDDAYEIAVLEGFIGTREEWLASLNPSEVSTAVGNIITKKIDGMYAPATDPLTMANAIDALPDKNILTDAQKDKLESLEVLETPDVLEVYDDKVKTYVSASETPIVSVKGEVGEYTISGVTGTVGNVILPTDLSGNVLFATTLEQLEGVITLKTFSRTFDAVTGTFTANLEEPVDIPVGEFISMRINTAEV